STPSSLSTHRSSISWPRGCRTTQTRCATSFLSCEPARCSLSTGLFRYWSSSRGACTFRLFSSTPVTSMARLACASWGCSMPSTIIGRRSSDEDNPMTTQPPIKTLFANDIHRRIEEVIKVDQTDEEIIRDEISEYVVTDAICAQYTSIFDAYRE